MAENPEDMQRRLEELLKVLGDRSGAVTASLEKLNARVGTASTELEKNRRLRASEKEVLEDAKESMKKYARELDKGRLTQEEYDKKTREVYKEIAGLTELTGDQKKQIIENIAATRRKAEAEVYAEKITGNFNKTIESTTKVLSPIGTAIGGIWRGTQGATNAIAGTSDVFKSQVGLAGSAATGFGSIVQSGGTALMSFNSKWSKGIGAGLTIAGAGFQQVGKSAELVNSVFSGLAEKAQQLQESYIKINQSGATLAGGMSELRDIAGSAGMRVTDLVGGVTQAQETFQSAGLSLTQATKMVGAFGKGLSQGKDAAALFAMGFTDVQDRVKLAAGAFDQARATGMSRAEAEKNLTALTVQYGKDLKTLQSIAGKDAEKALEKGRLEAQRGSLMAKLTNEQRDAYSKVYASLDRFGPQADKVRLALTQLAQGGAITDPDILINQPMKEMIERMAGIVQSGSTDAIEQSGRAIGEAAEKARLDAQTGGIMSQIDSAAVQMGKNADGIVAGSSALNNALIATKIDPAAGEEARKNVENLTSNTDTITKNLGKLDERFREITVNLEQLSLSDGVMANFTKFMNQSLVPLQGMIDKVKEFANLDISKLIGQSAGGGASNIADYANMAIGALGSGAAVAGLFRGGGGGRTPPSGAGPTTPPTGPTSPTGPKIAPGAASNLGSVPNIPAAGATGTAGAAANIAESGAAKSVAGVATKAAGKGAAKLIPGVGAVMGGLEAYEKVQQGDYVGAALAGAGGLASLLPGIGTAASAVLAAASALREITPSITPQNFTPDVKDLTVKPINETAITLDQAALSMGQTTNSEIFKILSDQAQILSQTKDAGASTSEMLSRLNESMSELVRATRDVVTNTERTARGVQ